MRALDPMQLDVATVYRTMIATIVPRPIAWVSTVSGAGIPNLAPFSFFNGVASNPPCLMISIADRSPAERKDTLRNIDETGQFVVNSTHPELLERVALTGAEFPHGVDEFSRAGLTAIPSTKVRPPRVRESRAHFECEELSRMIIGDGGPGSSTVIFGRIVFMHIDEAVYEGGRINPVSYDPLARLGGSNYSTLGEILSMPVPKIR